MAIRVIFLFFVIPFSIFSQDLYDIVRPWWGVPGPGGQAGARGFATVTTGGYYYDTFYNPSCLALADDFNLSFSLYTLSQFSEQVDGQSNRTLQSTRLDGLGALIPIPVYRGKLNIALGFSPFLQPSTNLLTQEWNQSLKLIQRCSYQVEGNLNSTSLGLSVEFRPRLFLGAAFHFISGYTNSWQRYIEIDSLNIYTFSRASEVLKIKNDYRGSLINLGLLYFPRGILKYGLQLRLPLKLSVKEQSNYIFLESYDNSQQDSNLVKDYNLRYNLTVPLRLSAGLTLMQRSFAFHLQVTFFNWNDFHFSSNLTEPDDTTGQTLIDDRLNSDIKSRLSARPEYHLGFDLYLSPVASLQLGFHQQPFFLKQETESFRTYSLGFNIFLEAQLELQLSLLYTSGRYLWQIERLDYLGRIEVRRYLLNLGLNFYL